MNRMAVNMERYYEIVEEKHTGYSACFQRIKWNVLKIAGYKGANGFIIQKFRRISIPANLLIDDISYYEAWLVKDGICVETVGQDYDDEFAIACPLCQLDVFRASLNKEGEYRFMGDVLWIDRDHDNDVYVDLLNWPTNEVDQAGGLRAVYKSCVLKNRSYIFKRDPFVHRWSLKTCDKIYNVAKEALFRMCPNPGEKRDQEIFAERLADMFGDEYTQIQEQLRLEWKSL